MRRKKFRAVYRLNRRRIRRLWQYVRTTGMAFPMAEVRGFFHWRYSAAFIFFFWGGVLAMIALGLSVEPFDYLFDLAIWFAIFGLVFSLGFWFTSEELERKKPKLTKKQKKRNERASLIGYRIRKWGVAIVI